MHAALSAGSQLVIMVADAFLIIPDPYQNRTAYTLQYSVFNSIPSNHSSHY